MKHPLRMFEDYKENREMIAPSSFSFWYHYLKNLAVVRFEWVNLPKEIEPIFIEETLFYAGMGAFVQDEVLNVPAFLNVNLTGEIDIYNFPEDRQVYAANGLWAYCNKENSVIVLDNPAMFPTAYTTRLYAARLDNLWRTIDLNVFAQRTPAAISAATGTELSYQTLANEYKNFIPLIKTRDTLDLDKMKVLN